MVRSRKCLQNVPKVIATLGKQLSVPGSNEAQRRFFKENLNCSE